MTGSDLFPWDEIPDSNTFPTGTYQMEISDLEDGQSKSGKRMFKGKFSCVAPAEYQGMSHFEYFVTGSEEQPGNIVPGSMGSRALKQALAAAQVPKDANIAVVLQNAKSKQLLLVLNEYEEEGGDYAGTKRNKIVGYYKIGDREVGVAPPVGGAPGRVVASGPSVAPPAAPAAPAPAAAAPAQPAPAPQPTPAPAPEAPQEAPPTGGPTMFCSICESQVLVKDYGAHVQKHAEAGEMPK